MIKRTLFLTALFSLVFTPIVNSQELVNEEIGNYQAIITEIVSEDQMVINKNVDPVLTQDLLVRFLEGPLEGSVKLVKSDTFKYQAGQKVFINYRLSVEGNESFYISDVNRLPNLFFLLVFFAVAVVVFGRWQGVRSLIALAGSFLVIFYVLLPLLLNGYPPVLVATLVAGLILFAAIFFTHGFNRESLIAFSGTMIAVCITGLLAKFSIDATNLTGFADENSVYLKFSGGGNLDFRGLLLGSVIVGVLGVLDDIAVTQAAIVSELYASNKDLKPKEVFDRAMRVGREHVGALVNTLVLAYTAASLPLLLLFYSSESSLRTIINRELFASEIVRTIVGSIGLIITVPIVTALAVKYLKDYKRSESYTHHVHHH